MNGSMYASEWEDKRERCKPDRQSRTAPHGEALLPPPVTDADFRPHGVIGERCGQPTTGGPCLLPKGHRDDCIPF